MHLVEFCVQMTYFVENKRYLNAYRNKVVKVHKYLSIVIIFRYVVICPSIIDRIRTTCQFISNILTTCWSHGPIVYAFLVKF
jgi:hypothetical protein